MQIKDIGDRVVDLEDTVNKLLRDMKNVDLTEIKKRLQKAEAGLQSKATKESLNTEINKILLMIKQIQAGEQLSGE